MLETLVMCVCEIYAKSYIIRQFEDSESMEDNLIEI